MAVTDRDELWEVQCQCIYCVETNHVHTISLSLAKPGKAMPGPYSSLTCFAGVRPGAVPERGEIRGHRHRRARLSIHSGQRPLHSGWYGPCSGHSGEARDRLWRSGSRPSISFNPRSIHTLYRRN